MKNKKQQIAIKLKTRQKEIINALLRFRYLTRPQIQTLLNHKHREKVIEWLNDLTEKHYIFRFYTKEFAGKPSEYCLDKASIPYLREKESDERLLKRIYTDKTRSQTFRHHNIMLATIYLSLLELTKETKATLSFYTKADLYGMKYLPLPNPDAYFAIVENNKKIKRYFLDMFDDSAFLKKRVFQYLNYFKRNYWQEHTKKPFPEIIFICHTEHAKNAIFKFIQKKLGEDSPAFYLSTREAIQRQGIRRNTLQKVE